MAAANFIYNEAKRALANKEIDWDSDVIKVMLVMTNTTADTEDDKDKIAGGSGFTTLDEADFSGYSAGPGGTGRKTLTNSIVEVPASDRAELRATNITWTALAIGASGRTCDGAIVYQHVSGTDDSLNMPIAWINVPFTPNGGDVTIQWDATGVIRVT